MSRVLHTAFVGAVVFAMSRAIPATDQPRAFAVLALLLAADAAWQVRRLTSGRA